MFEKREGEQELGFRSGNFGPATAISCSSAVSARRGRRARIARRTWSSARKRGQPATVVIDEAYRRGLEGLERASHVVVLTWLHRAGRNLIIQKPRHAGVASGVFALRSPARPNPVGLHVARLLSIDAEAGTLVLEAIDALDGTPVIDVKPYFASVDVGARGDGPADRTKPDGGTQPPERHRQGARPRCCRWRPISTRKRSAPTPTRRI